MNVAANSAVLLPVDLAAPAALSYDFDNFDSCEAAKPISCADTWSCFSSLYVASFGSSVI